MKLTTEVRIEPPNQLWSHSTAFLSLGSCFAEHLGKRLERCLFKATSNPLGICFNPLSLGRILETAIAGKSLPAEEFFESEGTWRHFDVHSSLAHADRGQAIERANSALASVGTALRECDQLMITLGTAWSYRHRASNCVVGHNHRLPLDRFERSLLTPVEIFDAMAGAFETLLAENSRLSITLTVSPVRHTRDGLRANNLSKASLLQATAQFETISDRVSYFPSYEIMIDELRDYRFYADDLIHPNSLARDYIWEKLSSTHFSSESIGYCAEIQAAWLDLAHVPQHPESPAYERFKVRLRAKIDQLGSHGLDVTPLREAFATIS